MDGETLRTRDKKVIGLNHQKKTGRQAYAQHPENSSVVWWR